MKSAIARLTLIGAALVLAQGTAVAAGGTDLGETEYKSSCAVCHGVKGKGDGPYAGILERKIPSLTVLTKNNKGIFPYDRLYEMIDGRADVKAHGPRDMPVWGNEYNAKAVEFHRDYYGTYNAEAFLRGRILALITYIHSLQEK